jgi:multicomponent Na+:H+ antiporter subunit G
MDVLSEILLFAGVALIVVSGIGLHRFDDVFARVHAAGKAPSLAFVLITAGALVRAPSLSTAGVLVLATVLLLVTTPIGTFMLARAAYRSGDQLSPATDVDELAESRRSGQRLGSSDDDGESRRRPTP